MQRRQKPILPLKWPILCQNDLYCVGMTYIGSEWPILGQNDLYCVGMTYMVSGGAFNTTHSPHSTKTSRQMWYLQKVCAHLVGGRSVEGGVSADVSGQRSHELQTSLRYVGTSIRCETQVDGHHQVTEQIIGQATQTWGVDLGHVSKQCGVRCK